jgi:hypothetical protein
MVVKMRSEKKIKQIVLPVQDDRRHKGCLIGNSNTGKLHSSDCSAINMMREDHKIPTEGGHFTPCGWCHACVGTSYNEQSHSNTEDPEGTENCMDKKMNQLFNLTGCLSCGSKKGVVKMFPDTHGVRLLGREGHWWIYFECSCGYQTAWWKAKNYLKNRRMVK